MVSHRDKSTKDLVLYFQSEVHQDLPGSDVKVSDLSVAYPIALVSEPLIWFPNLHTGKLFGDYPQINC
jgi:hypothetical protein